MTHHFVTVALAVLLPVGLGAADSDLTDRVGDAAVVLTELRTAPDTGVPQDVWTKAQCVAVIPELKKAAFIVGGEYGKGVVSCREGSGWSAPSFIQVGKGSVGFQIGAESIDLVLLIMNEKGMNRLLQNNITLGGEASVAAGPVGRDARAMTDAQLKAEILSYSRAQGLFAGVNLSGGVLKPDESDNREFYGRPITPREILFEKKAGTVAGAESFVRALEQMSAAATTRDK